MIITQIIGGLGNQMFQYAAARAVTLSKGTVPKLDTFSFSNYPLHQGFELPRIFDCHIDLASEEDICQVLGWQSEPRLRNFLCRNQLAMLRKSNFVVEPHFHYWEGIKSISDKAYLSGYWQSEKYFLAHEAQIRKDFTFKLLMNAENENLAKKITQVNAVSLHVRRGDYITNSNAANTHGICSLEYYQNAIRFMAENVEDTHFFLFSDDIEWVKRNLEIKFTHTFVSHNFDGESYNDMRLMSMCKHHIIANSSFSWWGAWLNNKSSKIVIAPKNWFAKNIETNDLIPIHWIRL